MKTVYEQIYGHPNPNGRAAMEAARKRAQEQLDALGKLTLDTKAMYNEIWEICGGELAEKFIMVKSMIESPGWFRKHSRYIDANFFKDENIDTLAEIVVYMQDSLAAGLNVNMSMVLDFVQRLKPQDFPVVAYAEEYREAIIKGLNSLQDIPEKRLIDARAAVLLLCLQRNTLRRTLSDPDVYIAKGVDIRNKAELDSLMNNEDLMMEILDGFAEEKALVSDVRTFIGLKGKEAGYDFNASDFLDPEDDIDNPNELTLLWDI